MTQQDEIKKLAELIKDVKIAMLTTVDQDSSLRSRPMATQNTPFDGDLWFFTDGRSSKIDEVQSEERVNISYANPDDSRYVSVSGTARVIRDQKKAKELWNPIYKAWFPEGLEDPNLALLKVSVEKAEYWDTPSGKMVQAIGIVKALATGKRYEAGQGEHSKVELSKTS
jgi:general stress protein 26